MLGHVDVQIRLLNTSLAAESAVVQPLTSMNHLVFFQNTLGDKPLSTLGAYMLPLLATWLPVHGGHVVS